MAKQLGMRVYCDIEHSCVELKILEPPTYKHGVKKLGVVTLDVASVRHFVAMLTQALEHIDPAPKPRYRIKVHALKDGDGTHTGFWTFGCPAHEDAGIGLWGDQPSAYAASLAHLKERHQ